MLYFLVIWNGLMAGCLSTGIAALSSFNFGSVKGRADGWRSSIGDRIVLSLWLGLIILSVGLLGISFVLPLSLGVGIGTLLLLTLGSCCFAHTRDELRVLQRVFRKPIIVGLLVVELAIASLINRPMVWFDSGMYHLGILRWLNQYGVVPGVSLINERFGFTSSWFAFSAPWVSSWFEEYIGAVSNGFIFLIAVMSALILGRQSLGARSHLSDWFGCIFFSLTSMAYAVTVFTGSPILVSFSPDLAITFMVGIVAWLFLLSETRTATAKPKSDQRSGPKKLTGQLLLLIFAAGALTFKLSALPIIPIVLLHYAHQNHQSTGRRLLKGMILLSVMLLPMSAFGVMTSGCPLYPSRFLCLDLPWTLSVAQSSKMLQPIAVLKGEHRLPKLWDLQDWIWLLGKRAQLFVISPETRGMVALAVLSVLLIAVTFRWLRRNQSVEVIWVLTLGLFGSFFILVTSPFIRFGLGYFSLIPALLLALACQRYLSPANKELKEGVRKFSSKRLQNYIGKFGLGVGLVILLYESAQPTVLRPPKLPSANITSAQVNDVVYVYPKDYQVKCWTAPLPCTLLPIEENIALWKPNDGIGGGFMRVED